jgi:hypothetical protein
LALLTALETAATGLPLYPVFDPTDPRLLCGSTTDLHLCMRSNGDKNGRLLLLNLIPDPCADEPLRTAMDDETANKPMNSTVMDVHGLSCTARSNLNTRFVAA